MRLTVTAPGTDPAEVQLEPRPNWTGLLAPRVPLATGVPVATEPEDTAWTLTTGPTGLPPEVDDLILVCEYAVTDSAAVR